MRRFARYVAIDWSGAKGLAEDIKKLLDLDLPVEDWAREEGIDEHALRERLMAAADSKMAAKAAPEGDTCKASRTTSLLSSERTAAGGTGAAAG